MRGAAAMPRATQTSVRARACALPLSVRPNLTISVSCAGGGPWPLAAGPKSGLNAERNSCARPSLRPRRRLCCPSESGATAGQWCAPPCSARRQAVHRRALSACVGATLVSLLFLVSAPSSFPSRETATSSPRGAQRQQAAAAGQAARAAPRAGRHLPAVRLGHGGRCQCLNTL